MNIKDDQVYFIAEIGSNHNQDGKRMDEMIYSAADAGFNAVKFQYFNADNMYWHGIKDYQMVRDRLSEREFPLTLLHESLLVAKIAEVDYGLSVFDEELLKDVSHCADIGFFKISSFDIRREDFITKVLDIDKPTVISLGCSDVTRRCVAKKKNNVYFLHCMSLYPAPIECNLLRIQEEELDEFLWMAFSTTALHKYNRACNCWACRQYRPYHIRQSLDCSIHA